MAGLFSKPKTPELPKPTPMADEEAIKRAKMRAVSRVQSSSGRDSTILSSGDKLGA